MTEQEKLAACPFCGRALERVVRDTPNDGMGEFAYHHQNENCHIVRSVFYDHEIDAWNTRAPQCAAVKPLEWEMDGNKVRLDRTMMFGKGYDYDGLEVFRQESYTPMCNYLIWPDVISSDQFSLYCSSDGAYYQSLTEHEAKAAAQAHHEQQVLSQIALRSEAEVRREGYLAGVQAAAIRYSNAAKKYDPDVDSAILELGEGEA